MRILLYPFSVLYRLVTGVRNGLYDTGYLRAYRFEVPVISVGNLTVGGTGKTPFIEYLVRILAPSHRVGILSRGYKRKTKGYVLATPEATVRSIGDEPLQYYRKYGDSVAVAVCEDRVLGIPGLLGDRPDTHVVLLDDAFQHRPVSPVCNILLSDYHRPFYTDRLLPAGNLRESRSGASRADVVVVTKCPKDVSEAEQETIRTAIGKYNAHAPVYFTTLEYDTPVPVYGGPAGTMENVVLVSGIAYPEVLNNYVKNTYEQVEICTFGDHHTYTTAHIRRIVEAYHRLPGNKKAILTTEKDMVKWGEAPIRALLEDIPVFYLPVRVRFLADEDAFINRMTAIVAAK